MSVGKNVRIRSTEGGEFDCYLVTPESTGPVPAIVLASAVHGVDSDIRAIADQTIATRLAANPDGALCEAVAYG